MAWSSFDSDIGLSPARLVVVELCNVFILYFRHFHAFLLIGEMVSASSVRLKALANVLIVCSFVVIIMESLSPDLVRMTSTSTSGNALSLLMRRIFS